MTPTDLNSLIMSLKEELKQLNYYTNIRSII